MGGWEKGIGKGDRLRGSGLIGSIAFQRGSVERLTVEQWLETQRKTRSMSAFPLNSENASHYFDYCCFIVISKLDSVISLCAFFSFQNCFGYFSSCAFPYEF